MVDYLDPKMRECCPLEIIIKGTKIEKKVIPDRDVIAEGERLWIEAGKPEYPVQEHFYYQALEAYWKQGYIHVPDTLYVELAKELVRNSPPMIKVVK